MDLEQKTSDERRKWEQPNYVPVPYPKMLYRGIADAPGWEYLVVQTEREEHQRARDGWRPTLVEARQHYEGLQADIGVAAAERAAADRKLSAGAQAEAKAAEEANDGQHLGAVPSKPLPPKRRVLSIEDLPPKAEEPKA